MSKPRPRGDPNNQATINARRKLVDEMLAQNHTRSEIVRVVSEKFRCKQRTVDRDIHDVYLRWEGDRERSRPHEVAITIQRLSHASRKLEKARAWSPWMRCEQLLAGVRGVLAPEKVDVRAVVAVAPQSPPVDFDLAKLPDRALNALGELLEALGSAPAGQPIAGLIGDASIARAEGDDAERK